MALSNLSDLGGQVVLGDEGDETILPAKGDGTAKPGNPVSINSAVSILLVRTDPSIVPSRPRFIRPCSKPGSGMAVVWAIIILENVIINKIDSSFFIVVFFYVCLTPH